MAPWFCIFVAITSTVKLPSLIEYLCWQYLQHQASQVAGYQVSCCTIISVFHYCALRTYRFSQVLMFRPHGTDCPLRWMLCSYPPKLPTLIVVQVGVPPTHPITTSNTLFLLPQELNQLMDPTPLQLFLTPPTLHSTPSNPLDGQYIYHTLLTTYNR